MNPKFGNIYKITNKVNGKVYIGQTIRPLKVRFRQHTYRKDCTYLASAINKYGKENFTIELIETIPYEKLNEREIYWISFYKSQNKKYGYNLLKGGNSGNSGRYKLTPEQIQEIIYLDSQYVSHIEIGKKFNIDRKTVTTILKRETPYQNKRVKLEERTDLNLIIEYLKSHTPTMKEVCEKFHIGRNTLSDLAKSINYKFLSYNERCILGI